MKPSSSPSDSLLGPLFGDRVPDRVLVRAMLEVESALALAGAEAGIVPAAAADQIVAACQDPELGPLDSVAAGNPVVPLVRAVRDRLTEPARSWLHYGATSQDILDTALMLIASRTLRELALADVLDSCAELAREHRRTLMPARTLGQQAGPTTFGLKAAGWLTGLSQARRRLSGVQLAVQLGGATGTLAALGDAGPAVLEGVARRLDLAPALPWHTNRQRLLELSAALAAVVVALGKIAADVTLLAQTEIGEVSEGDGGGSSALPHKRNPVDAILVSAIARRVPGLLGTLYAAGIHEHERATGAWHAEWEPLLELLRLTTTAVEHTRHLLTGLRVHPDRMRANLDHRVMTESVAHRLARAITEGTGVRSRLEEGEGLGRAEAHDLLARLAADGSLRDRLLADETVRRHLSPEQIDAALDPAGWLGSTDHLIDRALEDEQRG